MKKYFKKGLGAIIPISLVIGFVFWLYGVFKGIVVNVLPNSLAYQWWFVLVLILAITVVIFLLGLLVSLLKPIKPLRWLKKWFDRIIEKVPIIGSIYKFGVEIAQKLLGEYKNWRVVEVEWGGLKTLALLANEEYKLVLIATSPSPASGFLFKVDDYKETDIETVDYLKILASLAKINAHLWKDF